MDMKLQDERDIEILIDCLEAGLDAYEDDEDMDAVERIKRMLNTFNK